MTSFKFWHCGMLFLLSLLTMLMSSLLPIEQVLAKTYSPSSIASTNRVAQTSEHLTVPFAKKSVATVNSYSGPVTITVSGKGQAFFDVYSDAFYFASTGHNVREGQPATLLGVYNYGLCINDKPATSYIIPSHTPPSYDRVNHKYQFVATLPQTPLKILTFSNCDDNKNGNTGFFDITVSKASPSPRVTVQSVQTTDRSGNPKTAFARSNAIGYKAFFQNTGNVSVPATVKYQVTGPSQIYSWSGTLLVIAGTSYFVRDTSIPSTAPAGIYTLTVTTTYNGVTSSGKAYFYVVR